MKLKELLPVLSGAFAVYYHGNMIIRRDDIDPGEPGDPDFNFGSVAEYQDYQIGMVYWSHFDGLCVIELLEE